MLDSNVEAGLAVLQPFTDTKGDARSGWNTLRPYPELDACELSIDMYAPLLCWIVRQHSRLLC